MFDLLPDGFHRISAAAWIAVTWIAVSIPFVVLGFMAGLPFGFGALADWNRRPYSHQQSAYPEVLRFPV